MTRLPQQSRKIRLKHEEDLQEILEFDIYYDITKNRHVCRFHTHFSNKGGDTEHMILEFPLSKLVQYEVSRMHQLITERLKRRDTPTKKLSRREQNDETLRLVALLKEHQPDAEKDPRCDCKRCIPIRQKVKRIFEETIARTSRPVAFISAPAST